MTWARLDDRTGNSPEWVKLTDVALQRAAVSMPDARPPELVERARCLAMLAKAVHLFSLMWSVPALSDGKLSPAGVEQICTLGSLTSNEFYEAAELLVEAGAWRRVRPSKASPLGSYQMLLGWSPGEQPTREEDEQRRRMATLRGRLRPGRPDYPNRVAAVERAAGRCEYCDARLGGEGGEIDHVDPEMFSNDVDNLAHVCGGCNKKKGYHQLDEVGMAFTARALAARSVTCDARVPPARPGRARRQSRPGSGGGGSGTGSGSGRGPAGKRSRKGAESDGTDDGAVSDVA